MQISQAKDYFDAGVIKSLDAVRDPINPGNWLLILSGPNGQWTLQTKLGQPRSFASVDTLVGVVEKVTGTVASLRVVTSR